MRKEKTYRIEHMRDKRIYRSGYSAKITSGKSSIFTLIELLIVISILSILASLLLPALRKAREKSKATVCTGNMRQIGIGCNLYCSDNKEWLPQKPDVDSWEYNWPSQLAVYVNFKFDHGPDLFYCPAGKLYPEYVENGNWEARGYDLNRYVATNYGENGASSRVSSIPVPARLGIFFDFHFGEDATPEAIRGCEGSVYNNSMANMRASLNTSKTYYYSYAFRHGNKLNVLFADLHVSPAGRSIHMYPEDVVMFFNNGKGVTY